jgi:hypothetical protein
VRTLRAPYLHGAGAVAAVPSPGVPHIRNAHIDHAIDFWNAGAALRPDRARDVPRLQKCYAAGCARVARCGASSTPTD